MAVERDSHCKEWATGTETPSMVPTHQHSHWNLTLSYHQNVAGKGEPIRLALNHAGIPFTDVGHLRYHSMALPFTLRCSKSIGDHRTPPLTAHARCTYLGPTHPRACFQCVVSRTRRKCLAPLSCVRSLAHRSPLLTLLLCIRRRPLQHRFASRDEFTAMKEDGRLKFGQVPALAVTTGGKTTIINQRWVGRVRVVCVCVRRCSVHSPEVGAIIRRV